MKLLLLIGPLDKLLADKGLAWLTSAGNIALAFLIAHVAVKAVGKVAKTIANGRFKKAQDQPYFTHRVDTAVSLAVSISRYVFYFIAIAVSIGELGLAGAMNSMLAAAGIGTLALGIGAQSLIGDIVTGMFLLFEDQLSVGDYVSIGGVEGTVEEMTLRTVTLQGWRGEKTMIPNGQVKTVVNYSRRDYLAVVEMNIAQEANADRAMAIMHEELEKTIASFGIAAPIQDWGVVADNADSVTLRISVPTDATNQWKIQRGTIAAAKKRFREEGIDGPTDRHIIKESR